MVARGDGRGSPLWTSGTTAQNPKRGSFFGADMGSFFDAYLHLQPSGMHPWGAPMSKMADDLIDNQIAELELSGGPPSLSRSCPGDPGLPARHRSACKRHPSLDLCAYLGLEFDCAPPPTRRSARSVIA